MIVTRATVYRVDIDESGRGKIQDIPAVRSNDAIAAIASIDKLDTVG